MSNSHSKTQVIFQATECVVHFKRCKYSLVEGRIKRPLIEHFDDAAESAEAEIVIRIVGT